MSVENDPEKLAIHRYVRFIASICVMTVGTSFTVYSFLKSEFVTATEYAGKQQLIVNQYNNLSSKLEDFESNNELLILSLRKQQLEDRIFEIEVSSERNKSQTALMKRYQQEQIDLQSRMNSLRLANDRKLSRGL